MASSLGKGHAGPSFFKEAFDVVSVALRPSLSNSSSHKCLREFTTEVRELVGNVEMLWFAHRAILEFWSSELRRATLSFLSLPLLCMWILMVNEVVSGF